MHEALARANFERDVEKLSPTFLKNRNWTLNHVEYPILDVTFNSDKPLRLRLHCEQWNELPPSVDLLEPDGSEWTGGLPGGAFHQDKHESTGRTFICMVGAREYHVHSSHKTDSWANYKDEAGMRLVGLLDRFNRSWRKAVGLQ